MLDRWLSRQGLSLNVRLEADDHLVIRALVKGGLGFSLLTSGAFLAELHRGELQAWPFRPRVYWDLALVVAGDNRRTEMVAALGHLIRETVREQVQRCAWPGQLLEGRTGSG